MRKSVVAGIALAVVAVLVAVFFLLDRGKPPMAPQPLPEKGADGDARPEPSSPEMVRFPESREAGVIRPTRFEEPDAAAPGAIPEDDALRVLVLDEATGLPVPGAEVAWFDESTIPPPRRM